MAHKPLPQSAKVRLVIDGIALQTTVESLRTGTISWSLYTAWLSFEEEYLANGIIGKLSRVHDDFLRRDVDIQFDIY